jgi:aminopeptidase-like protein
MIRKSIRGPSFRYLLQSFLSNLYYTKEFHLISDGANEEGCLSLNDFYNDRDGITIDSWKEILIIISLSHENLAVQKMCGHSQLICLSNMYD